MTDYRNQQASRSKRSHKYSVKKRRRRALLFLVLGIVGAILIVLGILSLVHYRTFDSFQVTSSLDITNSDERTSYAVGEKGYIKCSGDGITFFDKKEIIWAENFEMTQPIMDVCGEYIAVADLKGSDIYIYNISGLVNRFSVSHPILDIEVSRQGVVAAATNEDQSNYIEVLDKEGNELITAKSVFSASGYLTDIDLSENGEKLVASFIYVSEGSLESKVVFYDFTGKEEIVGGFNQYRDTVITNVEFLGPSAVCVIGDSAYSFYRFDKTPVLVSENLSSDWEIQSLFFGDGKVGMITGNEDGENGQAIRVFNSAGKLIVDQGFDFSYRKAAFAGKNVVLYSVNDCEMYSFSGVRRFAYSFDERIEALLSCGNGRDFVYASPNSTEFIHIR